jgi:predicted polyphosphate/ATP-dependent NAD kinase
MRQKADEENFDEAFAQAYQVWGETQVGQLTFAIDQANKQISQELQLLLDDAGVVNVSKEVRQHPCPVLTSSPKTFTSFSLRYEGI